jgi:hypothetical protein
MLAPIVEAGRRDPWNKGKPVGQKAPLKLRDIWAIRVRLELGDCKRELAWFNLAIDSKLRGSDLVRLRVRDVAHGDRIAARTIVMQQKTQRPVQFEITATYRYSVCLSRMRSAGFPSLVDGVNSKPATPGSIVTNATVPSGLFRVAISVDQSGNRNVTLLPSLSTWMRPSSSLR